jgi:hypothetical protein
MTRPLCQWINLYYPSSKNFRCQTIYSISNPGDHFKVTVWVSVTISNPQIEKSTSFVSIVWGKPKTSLHFFFGQAYTHGIPRHQRNRVEKISSVIELLSYKYSYFAWHKQTHATEKSRLLIRNGQIISGGILSQRDGSILGQSSITLTAFDMALRQIYISHLTRTTIPISKALP